MTHPCDAYFRKHQHYPRVSIDSGVCKVSIEFAPGYVRITNGPPYSGTVYITRSAWLKLLKTSLPLTKWWHKQFHPDHDVPKAMTEAFAFEAQLSTEKRAAKKARKWDTAAAERQRKRYQAARARAAKKLQK